MLQVWMQEYPGACLLLSIFFFFHRKQDDEGYYSKSQTLKSVCCLCGCSLRVTQKVSNPISCSLLNHHGALLGYLVLTGCCRNRLRFSPPSGPISLPFNVFIEEQLQRMSAPPSVPPGSAVTLLQATCVNKQSFTSACQNTFNTSVFLLSA